MTRVAIMGQTRLTRSHQGLECLVEALGVRCAMLVEDHEVDIEELQPPVLMGAQQLANDVEILDLVDPHQDDGEIAGDAVGPQAGGTPLVACQQCL